MYFSLELQHQRLNDGVPFISTSYRAGTATGEGVRDIGAYAEGAFGSGLFSIAWAFECFTFDDRPQQKPRIVDRFMWEGDPDLIPSIKGLTCHCTPNGSKTHLGDDDGQAFSHNPIVKYAKLYPAGSEGFFYTDYSDAMVALPDGKFHAQIAQQSILPVQRSAPLASLSGAITTQLSSSFNSKCTLGVKLPSGANTGGQVNEHFILHYGNAQCDHGLHLSILYHRLAALSGLNISVYVLIGSSHQPTTANQTVLSTDTTKALSASFAIFGLCRRPHYCYWYLLSRPCKCL